MQQYHPENDAPQILAAQDGLRRQAIVSQLLEAVVHSPLPQVIGVEGDWGTGKSSVLLSLYAAIEKRHPTRAGADLDKGNLDPIEDSITDLADPLKKKLATVRAVWFEAWRYQHEPAPVIALLQQVRRQLVTGPRWKTRFDSFFGKLKGTAVGFSKSAVRYKNLLTRAFADSLDDVTSSLQAEVDTGVAKVSVSGPKIFANVRNAAAIESAAHFRDPLRTDHLRSELDDAIRIFIGDEVEKDDPRRLVIIIDDLDRCEAAAIQTILEQIKIYLDLSSCLFVLGINRRQVECAISDLLVGKLVDVKDPDDKNAVRHRAQDYLEKICANMIHLPRPGPEGCREFALSLLRGNATGTPAAPGFSALKDIIHCEEFDKPQSLDIVSSSSVSLTIPPLPTNPRRIKAFANQLRLVLATRLRKVKTEDNLMSDVPVLWILAALRQFFPGIHAAIESAPSFYARTLYPWACGEDADTTGKSILSHITRMWDKILSNDDLDIPASPFAPAIEALPDAPDGVPFFIQELIVRCGPLTPDYLTDLLS